MPEPEETPRQDAGQPAPESGILRPEHLAEGVRPIMACIGTTEQYGEEVAEIKNIENVGHDINYWDNTDILALCDFKNAGKYTYVISSVDSRPKFTEKLLDCTSLVAVGHSSETGTELSFLTHQDPKQFLGSEKKIFVEHLKERIRELKKKCSSGSIDVVIAGGKFSATHKDIHKYQESIELLGSIVEEDLGFEPLIICGPKEDGKDDVYFDTQGRKLFVVRPGNSTLYNDTFKPSEFGRGKKNGEKNLKK